jgi:Flp pilus assembly protein TadG
LRTSDRGSAVVEFILLVIPLVGLSAGTIGVTWFAFAKAQLQEVAYEAALQLSEPDSNQTEVYQATSEKVTKRLGITAMSLKLDQTEGMASVSLELEPWQIYGPMSLVLPALSAVSSVPQEN